MKIDAMPAGREMDALVAEKVLLLQDMDRSVPDGAWADMRPRNSSKPIQCRPLPHLSTDLASAWEVVEKMMGSGSKAWEIWSEALEGGQKLLRARDHGDAPLFICRAALKAAKQAWIDERLETATDATAVLFDAAREFGENR